MVVFFEVRSSMARYLSPAAAAQGVELKLKAATAWCYRPAFVLNWFWFPSVHCRWSLVIVIVILSKETFYVFWRKKWAWYSQCLVLDIMPSVWNSFAKASGKTSSPWDGWYRAEICKIIILPRGGGFVRPVVHCDLLCPSWRMLCTSCKECWFESGWTRRLIGLKQPTLKWKVP